MFTTLGDTFLIIGAKLIGARTSRLIGFSSTFSFGGAFSGSEASVGAGFGVDL